MVTIPQIKLNNHPLFPGKEQESAHRIAMAEHLGRPLKEWETVGLRDVRPISATAKGKPIYNLDAANLVLKGVRDERFSYKRDPAWKPDIMLDSGAYSAWKAGTKIDVVKYADFIHRYRNYFKHIINLDEIDIDNRARAAKVSFSNLKYLQGRGITEVCPVFHVMDDLDELKRMLDSGCTSVALATNSQLWGVRSGLEWYDIVWNYLVNSGGLPAIHVHGLAETGMKSLLTYPWASVDSAQWGKAAGMGRHTRIHTGERSSPVISFRTDGATIDGRKDAATLGKEEDAVLRKLCDDYGLDYNLIMSRSVVAGNSLLTISALFFNELEKGIRKRGPKQYNPPMSLIYDSCRLDRPAIQPNLEIYLGVWISTSILSVVQKAKVPHILLSYAYAGGMSTTKMSSMLDFMGVPENERDQE
jgi:hypothetical protein